MVDKTSDLLSSCESFIEKQKHRYDISAYHHHQNFKLPKTPFLIKAIDLYCRLVSFENIVASIYEDFISYHRFLPKVCQGSTSGFQTRLTDQQRGELQQNLSMFAASLGTEIHELRRSNSTNTNRLSSSATSHRVEVTSYLAERLVEFSRLAQTMQSRHEREECSPFLLFSQKSKTESIPSRSSAIKLASQLPARPSSVITQTISHVLAPEAETKEVAPAIASDFASRYEGEIASQSRVREYRQLGLRHHSSLMAEARGLRGRFSRELLEAHQVERSVQQVAGLVSHFAAMLQGQSGLAEGVHESAEHATDSVKQTERELLLTIKRSQNHSRNMTLLAVGLAFFLLLLDFITP